MKVTLTEMYRRAEKSNKEWFDMVDLIDLGRSPFWWYAQGRCGGFPSAGVGKYLTVKKRHVLVWLIRLGAEVGPDQI